MKIEDKKACSISMVSQLACWFGAIGHAFRRNCCKWLIGLTVLAVFPVSGYAEDKLGQLAQQAQAAIQKQEWDTALNLLNQARSLTCGAPRIVDKNRCADSLATIGWVFSSRGMTPAAVPYFEEAYKYRLSILGQYHAKTLLLCANYGVALIESGKAEEAEKVLLPCAEEINGVDVLTQTDSYYQLSTAYAYQHKFEDGEALMRRLMSKLERRSLRETPEYAGALAELAKNVQKQKGGRYVEAAGILEEALAVGEKVYGRESERYARWEGDLAELLPGFGRVEEAERRAKHGFEVMKKIFGEDHARTAAAAFVLGKILLYKGEYQEAETILREVHRIFVKIFGPRNQYLKDPQSYLILALERQGKEKEARRFERQNGMWVFREQGTF